jgi:CMP-N-acetylneuraminic acid synthetase
VNRYQTRFYRVDGSAINHDPENLVRTQDLELWFEENSSLYIFTAESFAKTNARIGARPIMFETPRLESIDIDTEPDWRLAEIVSRHSDSLAKGTE